MWQRMVAYKILEIMKGKIYRMKDENGELRLPVTVSDAIQMPDGSTLTESVNYVTNKLSVMDDASFKYEKLYLGTLVQGKPTKFGSTYDGITTTSSDASKYVVMCDSLMVPFRKCRLSISLPSGIAMKMVVNYNPASNGVETSELIGNTNYTFGDNIIYYRCYFYRTDSADLSVSVINTYISYGLLSITYKQPCRLNVFERNQEAYRRTVAATIKRYSESNPRCESNQRMVLCHTSDLHGDVYRARNFYEWCNQIGADYAMITGDEVGETSYNGQKYLSDLSNVKTLVCTGNHDCNFSSNDEAVYNNAIKSFSELYSYVHPTSESTYYYYDDTKWKIRFIALDIYGSISNFDWYNARITQTQIEWFVSTLASVPADYGVIVLMHAPEKAIASNDWGFVQAERAYLVYHENKVGDVVSIIIDAFIGKTTFSTSYTQRQKNSSSTETISVSGDFTNVASNEFICYVTGHEHTDGIGYYSGTTHRQLLLNIVTGIGVYGQIFGTTYYSTVNGSDMPRGEGQCEDSFNTYIIDRENKKVVVVRVGSNVNIYNEDRKCISIDYTE